MSSAERRPAEVSEVRTVALTGGGSGGHITPILAVAAELKRRRPDLRVVYVGQRGDSLMDIPAQDPNIDSVYAVSAGKFRRYHGESFIRQALDIPTLLKNARDFFLVLAGIWQSRRLMGRIKPDVVFSRGGFVSVPVCLGAAMKHIPYITHDSDPIPSLANRLIARWASWHAVAVPDDSYPYEPDKTVVTGIPVNKEFKPVTPALKKTYRREIKVPESVPMLFVIGGGLGSQRINKAVADALPNLLDEFQDLRVVHVVGRANLNDMERLYEDRLPDGRGRVRVLGFITDVYRYSGAADIVVSRAGATNLAEFALQGRACIVIPGSFLAGGHQIQNARYLERKEAALVIDEDSLADDPNRLAKQVADLLHDKARIKALGSELGGFARPRAAEAITDLILGSAA